ncbi:ComF family protein [Lentilactobacillus hilgardii]|uniref:ComF family protein n=1 Tax=Lentilactobacillus hilgardii TaxID=1588 RepID=UPI000B2C6620|nr:phosphoribosyltransferase family protein [Lentilactobacillus hilgardii]
MQRLNADQPFELIDHESELIRQKTIVVVDDVYTTGTTIRHAAALLYRAGARCVKGLTFAR